MATTTLMPLDPALSPQHVSRVLTISADLLPREVVAARRARRTRGCVLALVALVLVALGGWYMHADQQLRSATSELDSTTAEARTLQRKQSDYSNVVNVQAETGTIAKQLSVLLASDLPWATLIDTLRDTGSDAGVTVEGLSASLNATGTGTYGTGALPSSSGAPTIGTITVTGSGPDKPSVARYVDALATLPNVANPYLTSVAESAAGGVQYRLTVDITAQAQCGRFTTKCKTTGGN